ncbi:MAG: CHAT domain-containing protein, partial [Gelidibacter sp.]
MKTICFLTFFICGITLSQSLEEQIYNAAETFIADKNDRSYKRLVQQELNFKNNVKSKDEHLAVVFLQCNKAFYLNDVNQLKTAITTYEEAWKRYNNHNLSILSDYDMIEYCLKPLGNLYTKSNNYTNAENTIQQYITLAKKTKNKEQYVAGIINLSALYQTRGMHASVLELINQSREVSGISPSQQEKLNSLKSFSKMALKSSQIKDFSTQVDVSTVNSPFIEHRLAYQMALKNKDYRKALEHFNLSKELQKKELLTIREMAKRHVEEAQLYFVLNDFDNADFYLESALNLLLPNHKNQKAPKRHSLYAENTLIDIFDLRARLQIQTEDALAYYDLSFYVAALLNANLTSQESKLASLNSSRKRSEWCVALLYDIYVKDKNPDTFKRALYYAENDKAAVLQESFQKKSFLSKYPNDDLLLQERDLLKKQEHFTDLLIKSQLGYQKSQNDNLNKQLLEVSVALKSVGEAIDTKFGTTKSNGIDFDKLEKKLKVDQAALTTYFYGNHAIYQFEVSSGQHKFSKIELNAKVIKTITDFIHLFDNASLINNNVNAFTTQAFELYKLLHLDKVSQQPHLIIIPDGLLNFIPFEALLTKPTETTNFSKMPFLVTSQNVVYSANISFYLQDQSKKSTRQILGVFPVFEDTNQSLTYSIDEAHAIKRSAKTKLLMHEEATKGAFLRAASQYDVLHLSTHATGGDFTNPASISFYDEPMLVNELYSMDIHPELVVLSACETGIGKLQKGEGAMSIARGFQYAGAKNILFSLWQINDASTATLMSLFYQSYEKTNSANSANRQSKLDYLQSKSVSNIKKSPYYWSAFMYYGKIDVEERNETYFIYFYYFIG